MTQDEVVRLIQNHIDISGSLRALAHKWRVSAPYLSDVMLKKRYPGPKILKRLKLKGEVKVTREFTAVRE